MCQVTVRVQTVLETNWTQVEHNNGVTIVRSKGAIVGIYTSAAELIGNTPLIQLTNYNKNHGLKATIVGKVEFFNPAGSIKDRVALNMIRTAEAEGKLGPNTVIIEPTSGNTGIGLAALAAARGNRAIIVMPDTMSAERINLMRAYGAEVVLTPGAEGMAGSIAKAEEMAAEIPDAYIPGQFENPANPATHYATTGPEIWEGTAGKVDILVAGVGTGGTISGIGKYLKEQNPAVQVVAVEPAGSPLLSKGYTGPHNLQGIGANFVPSTLDRDVLDQIIAIENEEAYEAGRELAAKEGLLVGITSGAAVAAATKLAQLPENEGKLIVSILPDSGERYLTTEMFQMG